jgi:GNAT superfamily N-acetyltransferase
MSRFYELTAQADEHVDYEEVARLANEAFPEGGFTADHLRWLYERCFSQGSTVVSLRSGGKKVGQFVMLRQTVRVDGAREPACQLVDLFVLKAYRSRDALAKLYDEVARQCERQGIRFAIGMPNERAIAANEFFFDLKPHLWVDIRAGFALPGLISPRLLIDAQYDSNPSKDFTRWLQAYEPLPNENGVVWEAAGICERLNNSTFRYGIHAVENLLLISSPRTRRGVPYTLYCGFFVRRGASIAPKDMRAVVRAAAHAWKRPLFVYPGVYLGLPGLPGWRLPRAIRPSTMLIQLRDFHSDKPPLRWDRYQSIDFDFA